MPISLEEIDDLKKIQAAGGYQASRDDGLSLAPRTPAPQGEAPDSILSDFVDIRSKQRQASGEEHGYLETVGKGLVRGAEGIASGVGAIGQWAGEAAGIEPLARGGKWMSDYFEKAAQEGWAAPDPYVFKGSFMDRPSLKRAAGIISEALPSLAAALATGTVAGAGLRALGAGARAAQLGGTTAGAFGLGALEGAPQYQEAREAGKSIGEASALGAASTIGTGLLEFLPISRMLKPMAKGGIGKYAMRAIEYGGEEAAQEGTQQVFQNAIAKYGYDATRDLTEGLIEAIIGGAGSGAIAGTTTSRINRWIEDRRKAGVPDQEISEDIDQLGNALSDDIERHADNVTQAPVTDEITRGADAIQEQAANPQVDPEAMLTGRQVPVDEIPAAMRDYKPAFGGGAPIAPQTVIPQSRADEMLKPAPADEILADFQAIQAGKEQPYTPGPQPAVQEPENQLPEPPPPSPPAGPIEPTGPQGPAPSGPQAPPTPPSGLGDDRIAFIQGKVQQLGSREAVEKLYNDESAVSKYARAVADQVYGPAAPAPVAQPPASTAPMPVDLSPRPVPKAERASSGSNVSTLRGRIRQMEGGGINPVNFKGEFRESGATRFLIKKRGLPIDLAEQQLRDEGWIGPDENLIDVLRDPANLRRGRIAGEGVEKPVSQMTEQERQVKRDMEYEHEKPPGKPEDYIQLNAEDLPEGKKITLLEGGGARGWDTYTIQEKDPFSITLKDGKTIELKPLDKVQVRKQDLGGQAPAAAEAPAAAKTEPAIINNKPLSPEEIKAMGEMSESEFEKAKQAAPAAAEPAAPPKKENLREKNLRLLREHIAGMTEEQKARKTAEAPNWMAEAEKNPAQALYHLERNFPKQTAPAATPTAATAPGVETSKETKPAAVKESEVKSASAAETKADFTKTLKRFDGGETVIPHYVINKEPTLPEGHKVVASQIKRKGTKAYRISVVENPEGERYSHVESEVDERGSFERVDVRFEPVKSDDVEKSAWLSQKARQLWEKHKKAEPPALTLQGEQQMPAPIAEMRTRGKKLGEAEQGGLEFGAEPPPAELELKGEKAGGKEADAAKKLTADAADIDEFTTKMMNRGAARVNGVDYKVLQANTGSYYFSRTENGVRIDKGPGYPAKWSRETAIIKAAAEARKDLQSKPAAEKAPAEGPQPKGAADQIASMSMDEIDKILDDEEKKATAPEAVEKPQPARAPVTPQVPHEGFTIGGWINKSAPPATKAKPEPKQRTASEIVAAAGTHGVKGIGEAVSGLYELFGGKSLKSFPGGIDEGTYAKAKPHFEKALAEFQAAGRDIKEFVKWAYDNFSIAIKPYLRRFIAEKKSVANGEKENIILNKENPTEEAPADEASKPEGTGRTRSVEHGDRGPAERSDVRVSPDLAVGQRAAAGEEAIQGEPGEAEGRAASESTSSEPGNVKARNEGRGPRRSGGESARPDSGATGRAGAELEPTEAAAGQPAAEDTRRASELAPEDRNHVIAADDVIVPPGDEGKIAANIKAIALVKRLNQEDRNPTPEEKKILAQYVGWGAFAQKIFKDDFTRHIDDFVAGRRTPERVFWNPKDLENYRKWERKYGKKLHPALGGSMTQEEWDAARASTLNAHYTDREVIDRMWDLVSRLGFKGGAVLEPSAGVGHFIGLMPQQIAAQSTINAVELDPLTGQILTKLYPQARVQVSGFEKSQGLGDNTQDLVISNFPFGKFSVFDPKRKQYGKWSIHNYFFGRSIDAVRPGGLVVAITSHFTMDATSGGEIRAELAKKADFVGGIRLPYSAFKKNAGTEVVTDILVFRKKDGTNTGLSQDFRVAEQMRLGKDEKATAFVNEYFVKHPEMVLGKHSLKGSMYSENEYTVEPKADGTELNTQIAKAIEQFPEGIMGEGRAAQEPTGPVKYADRGDAEGSLLERDGKIYTVVDGRLVEPTIIDAKGKESPALGTAARKERAEQYIRIKSAVKDLIDRSNDRDATDKELETLRGNLNRVYDAFVKKFGNIGATGNSFLKRIDIEFPIVDALEVETTSLVHDTVKSGKNKGQPTTRRVKTYSKGDIFTKRTIHPFIEPESAETLEDAISLSEVYRAGMDTTYIAKLLARDEADVRSEMVSKGMAFTNPVTGLLEAPDTYLSGNVKKKLRAAQAALEDNPEFAANVKALEAVQPAPVDIQFIHFRLGTPWLPGGAINAFLKEVMGVEAEATFSKNNEMSRWHLVQGAGQYDVLNRETWGAGGFSGSDLVEDALNLKRTEAFWTDEDGKRHKDTERTEAAQAKQEEIQEEFLRWAREHKEWGKQIAEVYNEEKNGHVLRQVANPKIDHFPGASRQIKLRPLQKRFVARGLRESGVFAYGVGTGKTFSFISLAMEMRRVGTAKKPLIVVQNSTIGQYRKAFNTLYPGSRVLIPDEKQRAARDRQRLLSQMATGDWDAIVIPHSFFDRIADDHEREAAFIREQLDMVERAISDAEADGAERWTVKDLEALKKRKEDRLQKVLDRAKDKALPFEKMGIDALLVDEAHAYKRSEFFTKMAKVKGIDNGSSQRSTSLFLKARYVQSKTGGKNVILATGTPISNTTAELWTIIRYARPDLLEDYGVELFDDFAATFGVTHTALEETESGTYREVERFNRYVNGLELLTMWRTAADVQLTREAGLRLPDIAGGKPEFVTIERTPQLNAFIDQIRAAREEWDKLTGKEKMLNRHIPLVLFGLAKKAAVDMRLVNARNQDHPDSKLNKVVEKVHEVWKSTSGNRSTQAIFLDIYQDSTRTFNAYEDIRNKLIAMGVPSEEVAVITDAKGDAAREALFDRLRTGATRVIIGSTQKLGVGVNIQDLLIAAHHVDVPPRPMDIEQRNGRIVREGNTNQKVHIFNYGVRATLDSVMYDRLTKKQRFIDQMLVGDIEGREFDDPLSEEQASLSEMMAAFSGNPLVFEKTDIDLKVKKLRRARLRFEHEVSMARSQAGQLENETIPNAEERLKEDEADAAFIEKTFPEGRMTEFVLSGKKLDRKGLNEALAAHESKARKEVPESMSPEKYADYRNERPTFVGTFSAHGQKVKVSITPEYGDDVSGRSDLFVGREALIKYAKKNDIKSYKLNGFDIWVEFGEKGGKPLIKRNINKIGGLLASIENEFGRIKAQPDNTREYIAKREADLAEYKKIAQKPFAQAQELKDAEARLRQIEDELKKIPSQVNKDGAGGSALNEIVSFIRVEENDEEAPAADADQDDGGEAGGEEEGVTQLAKGETFNTNRALGATKENVERVRQLVPVVERAMRQAGLPQEVIDRVRVDLRPVLDISGKDVEQTLADWAAEGKEAGAILGATTIRRWSALMELSLEQDLNSLEKTALHESFHIAAKWMLPESDYARVMQHYRTEEGAADAFADFVSRRSGGRPAPVGVIRRAFIKLRNLLRQIGDFLRGKGWTNPEAIFGRLAAGEYAPHFGRGQRTTTAFRNQDLTDTPEFKKWFGRSKVVDEKGQPLKMYHGSIEAFDTFDKGKIRAVDYDTPFNGFWFTSEKRMASPAMTGARHVKEVYLSIQNPAPWQVWRQVASQVRKDNKLRDGARSYGDEIRARLQDMGYDGIQYRGMPRDIDEAALKRGEPVTFRSASGKKYTLAIDKEDRGLNLYNGEGTNDFVTGYSDLADFYNVESEQDWVAFEPTQIKSVYNQGTFSPENPDTRLRIGRKQPAAEASILGEILPAHVLPRAQKAIKGIDRGPILEKIKAGLKEAVKTFTPGREYVAMDPKHFGKAYEILRNFKATKQYADRKALDNLREIIDPKNMSKRDYELFTLKIALEDLARELGEGGKYENWQGMVEKYGELQFGFKSAEEVTEALEKANALVADNQTVREALRRRDAITFDLLKQVVDAKLLPESVLQDRRYFHHQVLEYMNDKFGTGTGAAGLKVGNRGYQFGRIENVKDYSLAYIESEFEVMAHQISQIEKQHNMDEMKAAYDIAKRLEREAKLANYIAVVGGQENYDRLRQLRSQKAELEAEGGYDSETKMMLKALSDEIWDLDPTMPFRQKMARGMAAIGGDKVPGSRYEDSEDLDIDFKMIAKLADQGDINARMIFKAMGDRNAFIKEALGGRFVTAQDLMRQAKPIEGSKGYTEWVPNPRSAFYLTGSIQDAIAQQIMAGARELKESDIRPVLARGRDETWIIPAELAQALESDQFNIKQHDNIVSKVSEATLNGWKRWILLNPLRIAKYNLNNTSGDFDIAFAYDPKILKYAKQAAADLWRWHYDKALSGDLKGELDVALRDEVIGSGMTVHDIPDVRNQEGLRQIVEAMGAGSPSALRTIEKFWQGSKNFTTWRENVLRLAAYRYFKDQIKAGKRVYGASEPAKVDATTEPTRKAALLSRELVGDYGALSQGGQWLRRKLIPFYSWLEINAPRYYRLYKNLAVEGEPRGRELRMGAVAARKGLFLSAKVFAMYAAANLFNHLFWPDEEDELGEVGRRQMHLILGRREDGSIITLRLQGALSDALSWFNLQGFPEDIQQIAAGKKSVLTQLGEGAIAPVNKLVQGLRPEIKAPAELIAGRTAYPEFYKPRPIRDRAEYVAQLLSADSLYRRAAGKPLRGGSVEQRVLSDLLSAFTYSADPGETSYYKARDLVNDYLKDHNLERPLADPTNRATALHYYKQAIKFGDAKAAEKYLAKYKELGGNMKGLQASVQRAHPLGALPNTHRAKFFNSLDHEDRQTIKRATEWYRTTFKGGGQAA